MQLGRAWEKEGKSRASTCPSLRLFHADGYEGTMLASVPQHPSLAPGT